MVITEVALFHMRNPLRGGNIFVRQSLQPAAHDLHNVDIGIVAVNAFIRWHIGLNGFDQSAPDCLILQVILVQRSHMHPHPAADVHSHD
ncbi:hypothetical protein D3C73_1136590 [compost metagenome]